jgi:hypothetical protein
MQPEESLSDIVRRALQAYVRQLSDTKAVRGSDIPSDPHIPEDMPRWMVQITHQLQDLSDTVRHLALSPTRTRLTPGRKPPAPAPQRSMQPEGTTLPYDPTKYVLGRLCPRRHEYGTTGQTLLRMPGFHCRHCENELARERRAAQRTAWQARQQPPPPSHLFLCAREASAGANERLYHASSRRTTDASQPLRTF